MHAEEKELFAQETLRDRGQMTRDEYEAFFAMLRYKDAANLLERYPKEKSNLKVYTESKSIYDQSGYDFEACKPMGFGWKTYWFAVKSTDIFGLIGALCPSYLVEQHTCWGEDTYYYAQPTEHFQNTTQHNYFVITQPCNGMIFVKPNGPVARGIWDKCMAKNSNYHSVSEAIPYPCSFISEQIGDIYFFWTQRVVGTNGFILWNKGGIQRAVSTWGLNNFVAYGRELEDEEYFETDEGNYVNEQSLYQMAHKWGANHNRIKPLGLNEQAYCWFLDASQYSY